MKVLFIIFFSLHFSSLASANDEDYAGKSEMNGIKYSSYARFENIWKQVTVRFRKDTGEMRFVYANPLALKALKNGSHDYPDGAVFGKIGMQTEDDSAFPSSAEPARISRIQIMVRDKKKYAETGGWGYALFDANGKTMPGEPRSVAMACAACHAIVHNRGEVFSHLVNFSTVKLDQFSNVGDIKSELQKQEFQRLERKDWPESLRKLVPKEYDYFLALKGALSEALFRGTLNEVQPLLAKHAKRTGVPVALISKNNELFSIVFPKPNAESCQFSGKSGVAMTGADSGGDKSAVRILNFCQTD